MWPLKWKLKVKILDKQNPRHTAPDCEDSQTFPERKQAGFDKFLKHFKEHFRRKDRLPQKIPSHNK